MTSQQKALWLLQHGDITSSVLTPYGSNYTFLVKVSHDEEECLGIYKPRDGEAPLWDFPGGTLYQREHAAYLLSQILGWDFIPITTIHQGPQGVGSLQLLIDHDPKKNYYAIKDTHPDALRMIACFDLLANNADRKPGHCIQDNDGKIWGIDHGLTFNATLKVRTVIWDFGDEPIPDPLLQSVEHLQGQLLHAQGVVKEMLGLLDREETAALAERASWLLTTRTFPGLYPRR